jgi:Glycosyl transferase family 2
MLGIAVITYNRIQSAKTVVERVLQHTTLPFQLIVADDGSSDGTAEEFRRQNVKVISAANMGVCWNKNRALFYLNNVAKCDPIILLEDDSWPIEDGWEADWVEAALNYGHINLAGAWFSDSFISGSGTPQDPIISNAISGQCSAYSADALSYVGYLDTRFIGYGIGHVEHSTRLVRAGYGGYIAGRAVGSKYRFLLINSRIKVTSPETFKLQSQIDRNQEVMRIIREEPVFRAAWRTDAQLAQLRSEVDTTRGVEITGSFDEDFYLKLYPDVASAVSKGAIPSGEYHYHLHGSSELRLKPMIRHKVDN